MEISLHLFSPQINVRQFNYPMLVPPTRLFTIIWIFDQYNETSNFDELGLRHRRAHRHTLEVSDNNRTGTCPLESNSHESSDFDFIPSLVLSCHFKFQRPITAINSVIIKKIHIKQTYRRSKSFSYYETRSYCESLTNSEKPGKNAGLTGWFWNYF